MSYFEVLVQHWVETTDTKGNPKSKKVKKLFLVNAMTVTEAEARVVKEMEETGGVKEFTVLSVNGSRIANLLQLNNDGESYFDVTTEIEDNESGKKSKENFLIVTDNILSVGKSLEWYYAQFRSYEIILIKRSKISELIVDNE
jgi:P pilus assembly chaperone PapD